MLAIQLILLCNANANDLCMDLFKSSQLIETETLPVRNHLDTSSPTSEYSDNIFNAASEKSHIEKVNAFLDVFRGNRGAYSLLVREQIIGSRIVNGSREYYLGPYMGEDHVELHYNRSILDGVEAGLFVRLNSSRNYNYGTRVERSQDVNPDYFKYASRVTLIRKRWSLGNFSILKMLPGKLKYATIRKVIAHYSDGKHLVRIRFKEKADNPLFNSFSVKTYFGFPSIPFDTSFMVNGTIFSERTFTFWNRYKPLISIEVYSIEDFSALSLNPEVDKGGSPVFLSPAYDRLF